VSDIRPRYRWLRPMRIKDDFDFRYVLNCLLCLSKTFITSLFENRNRDNVKNKNKNFLRHKKKTMNSLRTILKPFLHYSIKYSIYNFGKVFEYVLRTLFCSLYLFEHIF